MSVLVASQKNKYTYMNTVKALVSRNPRVAKKCQETEPAGLQECENTEFAWEFNEMGF